MNKTMAWCVFGVPPILRLTARYPLTAWALGCSINFLSSFLSYYFPLYTVHQPKYLDRLIPALTWKDYSETCMIDCPASIQHLRLLELSTSLTCFQEPFRFSLQNVTFPSPHLTARLFPAKLHDTRHIGELPQCVGAF